MPSRAEKMVAPLPHLLGLSASHCSSVKRVNGNFPSVLGVLAEATSWDPFVPIRHQEQTSETHLLPQTDTYCTQSYLQGMMCKIGPWITR